MLFTENHTEQLKYILKHSKRHSETTAAKVHIQTVLIFVLKIQVKQPDIY